MQRLDAASLTDLVWRVLEAARHEVVGRMNARGHPLTLVNHAPSVPNVPGSNSWSTEIVEEQVSGIYPQEILYDISDRSVPMSLLGLRDQLSPLAQYLLYNTNLTENRYRGLIGDDEIDGLLFRCVVPMAIHYLTSLADLASGERDRATQLADQLYELATSENITHVSHIAVAGIYPDEGCDYRGISVRALTARERGAWVEHLNPRSSRPAPNSEFYPFGRFPTLFIPSALIQVSTTRPFGFQADTSRLPHKVALSFFLAGFKLSAAGTITHFDAPAWASMGRNNTPFPVDEKAHLPSLPLSREAFIEIVDLAYKMPDFGGAESSGREVVLYRVLRGCGLQWFDSSFLDFAIALEAALPQKPTTELSYKFSLYGALFLREKLDTRETFKRLRNIYTVRSKLVHGGTISPEMRRDAERDAEELAVAVTRKAVESGWPNPAVLDILALESSH
jgi:Apea-like HEPN